MNAALVLQLLGSAGFLAGFAALLHFLSTWRATRSKTSSDAMTAYRTFVHGATDDRDKEIDRLKIRTAGLLEVRELLIDLGQDLIKFARSKGATPAETDHFQDRLDSARNR